MKKEINTALNGFLRVRAYMRYSSVMQDDGFSIEYQMSEITDYLGRVGMELQKSHIDKAQSGTKVAGREAFHELVRDVKEGLVDVIIVYKMSRMFRNSEESEYYRRIFRKHGIKLISVTENIDDETSSGRLTTSILSNIDEYQSEVISDHVRAGLREMAKQGLYTGRPLLIGYSLEETKHGKKKRKRFIVNEQEAPFIKRLFEMYASGMSCRQIARVFKLENIKTKRGVFFSENTIRRMLENDFYIGTYRYKVKGYEEIVIEDCVPALVSKELFAAVQARKQDNDPKLKPRYRKRLYALTGKMVCGKCGYNYIGTNSFVKTVKNGLTHYNYYTCGNRKEFHLCDGLNVRKEWIEEQVINEIKRFILNDEKIEQLAQEISALCENSPSQITDQIDELQAQQAKVEKRYKKFVSTFLADEDDESNIDEIDRQTINDMKTELLNIKKQLSVLTEQLRYSITPDNIKAYLYSMLKSSNENSIEIWNEIYKNFVDKVIVTDDYVRIQLKVYPAENLVDKDTLALPIVSLSSKIKRSQKYRPKNYK